ncbi:hypothetical protein BD626DRAFT_567069 [Schizophyllum amplum]|uniref:Uncharacterized protein n=1 Tax=Schizophyllum amplum TaxID=97359 RepID=A0A550CK27_9AGAR|nr:hypothetical protein BD626DRAFT_567069 [Auriculariopsis ampla]
MDDSSSAARPSTTSASGVPAPASSSSGGSEAQTGEAARASLALPPLPVFDRPRLLSSANYDLAPTADMTMTWILPYNYRRTRRTQPCVVAHGTTFTETNTHLWSSNIIPTPSSPTTSIPFFPGLLHPDPPAADLSAVPGDPFAPVEDASLRYSDGHLGPGDPCEHAQYFRRDLPYLAFLLRPCTDLVDHVAYRNPLCARDLTSAGATGDYGATESFVNALQAMNGVLDKEMRELLPHVEEWPELARCCPQAPAYDTIQGLLLLRAPALHIDRVTHVQRQIRAKLAWLEMARLIHQDHGRLSVDELRRYGPLDASMKYLGVWINTAPEHEGLWLFIRGRVPVYIVSPGPRQDDTTAAFHDFVRALPPRAIPPLWADCATVRRAQHVPARLYPRPFTIGGSFWSSARNLGWRENPVMDHHVYDVPGFPHGWVHAPIIPNAKTSRSRDCFCQMTNWNGDNCFLRMNEKKAKKEIPKHVCLYDEENGRLYVIERPLPTFHGVVEAEKFGLPIPRWPHYYTQHVMSDDERDFQHIPCGRWGYFDANPGQSNAGQVQIRPLAPAPAIPTDAMARRSDPYEEVDYDEDDWAGLPNAPVTVHPPVSIAPAAAGSTTPAAPSAPTPASGVPSVADPATTSASATVQSAQPTATDIRMRSPTPVDAPRETTVGDDMEVDSPSARSTAAYLEEITRRFTAWQATFPPERHSHEPRVRPSRLAPQDRGRSAYYVRATFTGRMSFVDFLRHFEQAAHLRNVEVDAVIHSMDGPNSAYGIIVPDQQLADSLASFLQRRGLGSRPIRASSITAASYTALAATGASIPFPPSPVGLTTPAVSLSSKTLAFAPSSVSFASFTPTQKIAGLLPPALAKSKAPITAASSSVSSRGPVIAHAERVSIASVPEASVRHARVDDALFAVGRRQLYRSGSFFASALTETVRITEPVARVVVLHSAPASVPASALTGVPAPPPVMLPAWPLAGMPHDFHYGVFCRMLASWPAADHTQLAQVALTVPMIAPGAPVPLLPQTPGAGPSTPSTATANTGGTAPSLLARIGPASLASRLTDGPGAPALIDRLSDAQGSPHPPSPDVSDDEDDSDGAASPVPRRRRRGGKRVRNRIKKGRARDGDFDPYFPPGGPPGAGGAGGAGSALHA